MALVICPECGKENVSDSAISCPDCGYAIKEHFDRIKLEEKRNQEKRLKEEQELLFQQEKEKNKPERKNNKIEQLEKEIANSKKEVRGAGIGLAISLPLLMLCWHFSENGSLGILIVLFGIAMLICGVFLISGINTISRSESDLDIINKDFDEYEKIVEKRDKELTAQMQIINAKNASKHPRCPLCGSTNTERLSTLNKTVSIAAVGLASSKIGKQYQCKNCKYKF